MQKKVTRLVACILSCILIFAAAPAGLMGEATVAASDDDVRIVLTTNVPADSLEAGDVITVTISLANVVANTPGFRMFDAVLVFDDAVFEQPTPRVFAIHMDFLMFGMGGPTFQDPPLTVDGARFFVMDPDEMLFDGGLIDFNLRVRDDAPLGNREIGIAINDFTYYANPGSPQLPYVVIPASVTIVGDAAPTIIASPTDMTAEHGENATTSVTVTGRPAPSFQWYVSTNNGDTWAEVVGATTATLTLTNVQYPAMDGNLYRVRVWNTLGTVTSDYARLTVNPAAAAPTITTPPADATVYVGETATFTVVAEGADREYQWQASTDNGATWVDITNATSATLTLNNVTLAMSGNRYRVVVSNDVGYVVSAYATLAVELAPAAPTFPTQPQNVIATAFTNATFTAVVAGNPAPAIQWQEEIAGEWVNMPTQTGTTLTLTNVQQADSGRRFRLRAENSVGIAFSNEVTLTVGAADFGPYSISITPANRGQAAGVHAYTVEVLGDGGMTLPAGYVLTVPNLYVLVQVEFGQLIQHPALPPGVMMGSGDWVQIPLGAAAPGGMPFYTRGTVPAQIAALLLEGGSMPIGTYTDITRGGTIEEAFHFRVGN